MLVSAKHRLVILSTPKCASTSLEQALGHRMDLVLRGNPDMKHTAYRRYERFIKPYLEASTKGEYEVVCLMREPVSWLHSWWRYRGRPGIRRVENSTRGMSFPDFVEAYMDGQRRPANLGQQSQFIADKHGNIGVHRIFRYEALDGFVAFLENRLGGKSIKLGHENRSPDGPAAWLPQDTEARLKDALAIDWKIYETLAE